MGIDQSRHLSNQDQCKQKHMSLKKSKNFVKENFDQVFDGKL
jgi:hypothetical protein